MPFTFKRSSKFNHRPSKDKEHMRRLARAAGRRVLWLDSDGFWHAAVDRNNTPHYALETEDVK